MVFLPRIMTGKTCFDEILYYLKIFYNNSLLKILILSQHNFYASRSQYNRGNSQYVRTASRFPYKYWDSETWYQKYARNVAPKNNVNRYLNTNIQRQTSSFDTLYNHPIVLWIRGVQNSLRRG